MTIKYIESIDDVIEIHRKTVEVSGGGSDGILNTASLESAIDFIRDDHYCPVNFDCTAITI